MCELPAICLLLAYYYLPARLFAGQHHFETMLNAAILRVEQAAVCFYYWLCADTVPSFLWSSLPRQCKLMFAATAPRDLRVMSVEPSAFRFNPHSSYKAGQEQAQAVASHRDGGYYSTCTRACACTTTARTRRDATRCDVEVTRTCARAADSCACSPAGDEPDA